MISKEPLYYADYLQLDKILNAQHSESEKFGKPAHDETLFIIIHQTYELWFKQIIHELDSLVFHFNKEYVPEKKLHTCVSRLKRVVEIQKILIDQIRVMETMTSLDFMDFRDYLQPASGFQSLQFRLVEVKLGLKSEFRTPMEKKFFNSRLNDEDRKTLFDTEQEPSLFELLEKWLERMPFADIKGHDYWSDFQKIVTKMLEKDEQIIASNPYLDDANKLLETKNLEGTKKSFEVLFNEKEYQKLLDNGQRRLSRKATLSAIFILLNRDEPILSLPFELLHTLIDIDELFTTWRYRHAIMAHRLLGSKIGTGGSSGHEYLKKTTENSRVFVDFFNLSTFLIPRSERPVLPEKVRSQLGFHFHQYV
jgi:tryptophan 2,3-dioxygenase